MRSELGSLCSGLGYRYREMRERERERERVRERDRQGDGETKRETERKGGDAKGYREIENKLNVSRLSISPEVYTIYLFEEAGWFKRRFSPVRDGIKPSNMDAMLLLPWLQPLRTEAAHVFFTMMIFSCAPCGSELALPHTLLAHPQVRVASPRLMRCRPRLFTA